MVSSLLLHVILRPIRRTSTDPPYYQHTLQYYYWYLSIRLFIVLYRIVSSLFTCRVDSFLVRAFLISTVSIHPSLNCVLPDLFLSLSILFFFFLLVLLLQPYLSIRLFNVSFLSRSFNIGNRNPCRANTPCWISIPIDV